MPPDRDVATAHTLVLGATFQRGEEASPASSSATISSAPKRSARSDGGVVDT